MKTLPPSIPPIAPANTREGAYEPPDLLRMAIHQNIRFQTVGGVTWEILRIPGGWVYSSLRVDEANRTHVQTSLFIPFMEHDII